jgi:hypothetical protein
MSTNVAAMRAVRIRSFRDWETFSMRTGQVVFKGRYYFAWNQGHFIGAYDTLDDAVESLAFRNTARCRDSLLAPISRPDREAEAEKLERYPIGFGFPATSQ